MWFAFKFYLWQRSYNTLQNLYFSSLLWFAFKFYLWQRSYNKLQVLNAKYWLWFAFKFYLWQRSYNDEPKDWHAAIVVICFQILSLTTFLQYCRVSWKRCSGCDLLSNFIFDNVLTMPSILLSSAMALWFAFKFYLWQRSYNKFSSVIQHYRVVICFQILSLTTFLQFLEVNKFRPQCCDLLSNFIFDNVLTI